MRNKAVFAVLGILVSIALAAWLVGPGLAEDGRKNGGGISAGDVEIGDGVVRAGNAVIDDAGVRIEGGPSDRNDGDGSGDETDGEDRKGTPVADGEAVLKFMGDEGVEFSGKCSVGGDEQEMAGQVPDEFTFQLDGDELECEVRKEGDNGKLKMILLSGNSRSVQGVTGDSTMKLTFSGNGASSSTNSGSSSIVSQSSSSVVQSNTFSAGDSSIVQSNSSSKSD